MSAVPSEAALQHAELRAKLAAGGRLSSKERRALKKLDAAQARWAGYEAASLSTDPSVGSFDVVGELSDAARAKDGAWAAFAASLETFRPDICFFSAGFDGHRAEAMVGGKFEGQGYDGADFALITRRVLRAIGKDVPVVSVLEGGYTPEAITDGLKHHLKALAGL